MKNCYQHKDYVTGYCINISSIREQKMKASLSAIFTLLMLVGVQIYYVTGEQPAINDLCIIYLLNGDWGSSCSMSILAWCLYT